MNYDLKFSDYVVKSGAIISTIGVIMLIIFGVILLSYPVLKVCEKTCNFVSKSPQYLNQIISPIFLFFSLILISLGVFLIRIVKWKNESKNTQLGH